jgi:aspartate/tyrosine/aromatic aminotransferase
MIQKLVIIFMVYHVSKGRLCLQTLKNRNI